MEVDFGPWQKKQSGYKRPARLILDEKGLAKPFLANYKKGLARLSLVR